MTAVLFNERKYYVMKVKGISPTKIISETLASSGFCHGPFRLSFVKKCEAMQELTNYERIATAIDYIKTHFSANSPTWTKWPKKCM